MAPDEQQQRHGGSGSGSSSSSSSSRERRKRRRRLLLVVEEERMDRGGMSTYHILSLNLKHMFASPTLQEDNDEWAVLRPFPNPVAQFDTLPSKIERLDFAVVGSNIVGVSCSKRTVLHDIAGEEGSSPGPELGHDIPGGAALIPLGRRVYAIGYRPSSISPSFQALLPPPASASASSSRSGRRRRWSWRSLPKPHRELWTPGSGSLQGWMGAGTHVWVSAQGKGTYSFDTARPGMPWRKDGEWELPFKGRALFVPDFGLCFAICPSLFCLFAFDLPTTTPASTPPVVRYVWPESFPHEYRDIGCYFLTPGSLAYLGDGNFCFACTMAIEHNEHREPTRFALLLVAIQVVRTSRRHGGGEGHDEQLLSLVNRKLRCYDMPTNGGDAYVLQPALPGVE